MTVSVSNPALIEIMREYILKNNCGAWMEFDRKLLCLFSSFLGWFVNLKQCGRIDREHHIPFYCKQNL